MTNKIRKRKQDSIGKSGKLVRIQRPLGVKGGNLAGVCEGLGAYFGTDPMMFRLGFIGLTFFSGFGILAYMGMAIGLPDERGESLYQTIREHIREGKNTRQIRTEDWETEDYHLCDHCNTVVKYGSKFCHHCGQKL